MKWKRSINGLDGAGFSLYFIEDNTITNYNNSYSTLTQVKIYMYTNKPLILLHVFEKKTVLA